MKPVVLKRLLLLFWAAWLALVTASNLCDALKGLGVLDDPWPFASGNYGLIVAATARYQPPAALNCVLFAGVMIWEGTSALLFLRAAIRFRGRDQLRAVHTAFAFGLLLWAAFMIADEIVFTFGFENTHRGIFVAQLATWLAIELTPDGAETPPPAA
jgi:hypothetical protein